MFETTLFIPLAGRKVLWPKIANYLENQTAPHETCQLHLLNTANDHAFDQLLMDWILNTGGAGYGQVNVHKRKLTERSKLADADRNQNFAEVNRVMISIYEMAKQLATGKYLYIVEDDTIPPYDALPRLKQALAADVFSVSGAYRFRHHAQWTAWKQLKDPLIDKRGQGVECVEGTGFGCLLARTEDFKAVPLTWSRENQKKSVWGWGYDMEFFDNVKATGKKVLIHWDVVCQHLSQRD